MQSLDDVRFELVCHLADLLTTGDFGPHHLHPACKAMREGSPHSTTALTPEIKAAHWILLALNDKEVAQLDRHIQKKLQPEELDPALQRALERANRNMPKIAREMMFDDVVEMGNRVRKVLHQRMRDARDGFDMDRYDEFIEKVSTLTVVLDRHGEVKIYDLWAAQKLPTHFVEIQIDLESDSELKEKQALYDAAFSRAASAVMDFTYELAPDWLTPTPTAEEQAKIEAAAEQTAAEAYWRHVVSRAVEVFRDAYAKASYAPFDPDTFGDIEMYTEVNGVVTHRDTTKKPFDAEYWYALSVSKRVSDPNAYVVIESSQPCKCPDARFCISEALPEGLKQGTREINKIRWRQFWARPLAWTGPTSAQLQAISAWCSGDPEDPDEMVAQGAATICGVTSRTWRAWCAPNSSQRIPFQAWQLLLVHADVLAGVGKRKMEVTCD